MLYLCGVIEKAGRSSYMLSLKLLQMRATPKYWERLYFLNAAW
jgi:hypothetical protein